MASLPPCAAVFSLRFAGASTQEKAEFDSGRNFRGVFPEPTSDRCGVVHGIIIGAAVDRLGQRIQLEMVSRDDAEESGTRSARCPEIFRMLVLARRDEFSLRRHELDGLDAFRARAPDALVPCHAAAE